MAEMTEDAQKIEETDARSAVVDQVSDLINTLGKESLFPCARKSGPRGRRAEGKHDEIACLNVSRIEWGRALTSDEYNRMCAACRAYYFLSAARNDLITFIRTQR